MPYSREEFANQIRAKYPAYANWPTDHLVDEVLSKHPDYASWVVPQTVAQKAAASLDRRASGGDLPPGYTNDSLDQNTAQNFVTDTPLGQRLVGAGMGMANTSRRIGALVSGAATGDFGPLENQDPSMKPITVPQKQGYGAEQIGEYLIPAAAGASVARTAPLLARAAGEGVTAAAVAKAQDGDPALAGGAAAVAPVAGAVLQKAAPWMMDTFLGVKSGPLSRGANPGQEVIDQGAYGVSPNRFLSSIQTAKANAMKKLSSALGRVDTATIDASGLVSNPLDAAAKTATAFPEQNKILLGIKQQIADEAQQNGWNLEQLTPSQANTLRMRVNQIVNAAKGDPSVPEAIQQALYKVKFGLNDAIDSAAPGAKSLNRSFSNLEEAESAYKSKLNSSRGHFWDIVAMMPAMHNLLNGEPSSALATMLKGLAVKQAISSPAVVGAAAQGMYRGGGALASGIGAPIAGGIVSSQSQDDR